MADSSKAYILGDDPKNLNKQNVFSAAPILEDEKLVGYAYIILAGEAQQNATAIFFGSYILRLGWHVFLLTLLGALIIGAIAVWLLTKNLRVIIDTVRRFKEGDYQVRINDRHKGGFTILADTYNDMANQIVANIEQIKSIDALRQELIANVSHDLRTPLAILQGYIETLLLKKGQLSEADQQKYLQIVLSSSEKVTTQVSFTR